MKLRRRFPLPIDMISSKSLIDILVLKIAAAGTCFGFTTAVVPSCEMIKYLIRNRHPESFHCRNNWGKVGHWIEL